MGNLRRRLRIALLLVTLVASACSSTDSTDGENASNGQGSASDSSGTDVEVNVEAPPNVPGAPLNPFDLRAGQCFNEGSWYDEVLERRIDLTAMVECDQPHQKEMYHEAEFPAPAGAPYPGEAKMTEWSTQVCYEAFVGFVGEEYELSQFELGFLQPTEATFEHEVGRHRRVTCYLFDPSQEVVTGSAKSAGV